MPSSPDAGEDDGTAMGLVYDGQRDATDLVLLDAATLDDVARVRPAGARARRLPRELGANPPVTCAG